MSHASAIQETKIYKFIDLENSVMDWRFLEFGEIEVNIIFLYNAVQLFIMPWSRGCKIEVTFSGRNLVVTFGKYSTYG
jgi:hypothetical protein